MENNRKENNPNLITFDFDLLHMLKQSNPAGVVNRFTAMLLVDVLEKAITESTKVYFDGCRQGINGESRDNCPWSGRDETKEFRLFWLMGFDIGVEVAENLEAGKGEVAKG